MNKPNTQQTLQDLWECAVELAAEKQSRASATSEEELKVTEALKVRTRIQAGAPRSVNWMCRNEAEMF